MTEYTKESIWLKKSVYSYDSAQKLVVANFYGQYDTVQCRWLVQYDNHGRIAEKSLSGSEGGPCQQITYKYDQQGRKNEERDSTSSSCFGLFDWLQGSMSNWFSGLDYSIMVTHYQYDIANRVARMESEGAMYGSTGTTRNIEKSGTFETTSYSYDSSNGKIAQTVNSSCRIYPGNQAFGIKATADTTIEISSYKYYSNNDKVAQTGRETFHITAEKRDTAIETTYYKYDDNGRKAEEFSIWKSEDRLSMDSARNTFRYDSHSHLIESIEYHKVSDMYAKPGLGKIFASVEEYVYDSLNTQTAHNRYYLHRQENGIETKYRYMSWKLNDAEEKKEYDRQGNIIKVRKGDLVLLSRDIEYF